MTRHKRPLQRLDLFETAEDEDRGYIASSGGTVFSIGAAAVEAAVLKKAQFAPVLRLNGAVFAEPEGLEDAVIEAAIAAGDLRETTLSALVTQALAPDLLALEENAPQELKKLKAELQRSLALVESVMPADDTRKRSSST
jgi:hypothetical protein